MDLLLARNPMMYVYLLAGAIALAFPSPPPHPVHPLPELTDRELGPPNHILTPKNKVGFVTKEVLPVGDVLGVILPVQQGTTFRWRVVDQDERVFHWLNPNQGRPDLRSLRKDFEVQADGPLGRPDALQVFWFKIMAPARGTSLRFRLVGVLDNKPSNVTFDVILNTGK